MNSVLKSDSFSLIGHFPGLAQTATKLIAHDVALHLII